MIQYDGLGNIKIKSKWMNIIIFWNCWKLIFYKKNIRKLFNLYNKIKYLINKYVINMCNKQNIIYFHLITSCPVTASPVFFLYRKLFFIFNGELYSTQWCFGGICRVPIYQFTSTPYTSWKMQWYANLRSYTPV